MKFYFVNPNHLSALWHFARIGVASLAAVIAANDVTGARSVQNEQSIELRSAGEPIIAIVSLRDQRITVYDAKGWIRTSPRMTITSS
jgi:hypothetical protein